MNWFKDLFIRKDSQAESLPPIPERKPNISEPVISFVETFKANPKRFKVFKNWDTLAITSCIHSFTLKDKYNNLQWDFNIHSRFGTFGMHPSAKVSYYPKFLTKDEADFIYKELSPVFNDRLNRYRHFWDERFQRKANKEREALKKVYCK